MELNLISDPFFYVVAVPALLLVGISKGGFGGGVGLIGVPLMGLAVPLAQAAAILLPVLCLMDLFALAAYRGQWSRANLRILLPASLAGIGVGALVFGSLNDAWIRGIVGALSVGFVVQYGVGRLRGRSEDASGSSPSVWRGGLWGTVAGFTSTIAHAGGPPLSIYLLPQRLHPTTYVGTTAALFTAINYTKLLPYAWLGLLHGGNLTTSLALAPLAPVGIWLGRWLHVRVESELFYRLAYALLLLIGARLLYDGWLGIS